MQAAWQDERVTSAAPAEQKPRTAGRGGTWLLLVAGAVLALTSCTAAPAPGTGTSGDSNSIDATPPPAPTAQPETSGATEAAPAGPDEIAVAVEVALQALAGAQDSVTSDDVRTAIGQGFADAGSVPETVEVSIDRTPTGLDVDAIQGAGRIGESCVIGEVREGTVTVTVLPVLATGLCFVGDQR